LVVAGALWEDATPGLATVDKLGKFGPVVMKREKFPTKQVRASPHRLARASVFRYPQLPFVSTMAPKDIKKIPDKLTDSEKKKIKQENKAKANPERAAEKKEKNDAKRETRKVSANTLLETCLATAHLQLSLQASNAGRPLAARDVGCWSKAACTCTLTGTAPRSVAGSRPPPHQCGVLT